MIRRPALSPGRVGRLLLILWDTRISLAAFCNYEIRFYNCKIIRIRQIRIHRKDNQVSAMKWITTTDLDQWADSREAQSLLPELVLRLIRATTPAVSTLRFPSGDAVRLTGWDGVLESEERVYTLEPGLSLWECGTTKEVRSKADDDYAKRSQDTLGYDPKTATYIFVTPRLWNGASKWVQDREAEGIWKRVVVLTAVELEDWLSLCPAVALWLAERLYRHPIKASTVDSFWNKWSSGRDIILKSDLLLGGRETERGHLCLVLREPSISVVQSMAQAESVAFAVACILEDPQALEWKSKCLVVDDDETLTRLINEYNDLILIVRVDHKEHSYATRRGYRIIYATSAAEVYPIASSSCEIIRLPLIDHDKFVESLQSSGLTLHYAEQLSRETVRNITILRRRLGFDLTTPAWAEPDHIRDLIPAVLIGRWNDRVEGDRTLVARIAGESYERYAEKLQRWANSDDTPLVIVDGKWRIISPYEAFLYAKDYLTANDFDAYRAVVHEVITDNDPDAIEKLTSTTLRLWEHKQHYSGWVKEGVFQSAVLISLIGETATFPTPQPATRWIDSMIRDILDYSTLEWWLSNRSTVRQIAEASPQCYIAYLQQDLKQEDSIIKQLFSPNTNKTFWEPRENYTEILGSLQMLLWEPEFLLPIGKILMELSLDIPDSANKPVDSLQTACTVWAPQTYADTGQRLQVLTTLAKTYPSEVFTLCKKMVNRLGHGVIFPTHPMRWRRFGHERPRTTRADLSTAVNGICRLLISICDCSDAQIGDLLELADQIPIGQDNRAVLFGFIVEHKDRFKGREAITDRIRSTIAHHKAYPEAEWALGADEIARWEVLLQDIESEELKVKYRWLFKDHFLDTAELGMKFTGVQAGQQAVLERRSEALTEIYQSDGLEGICEFSQRVAYPDVVGEVYAHSCVDGDFEKILFKTRSGSSSLLKFAQGFFRAYTLRLGAKRLVADLRTVDPEKSIDLIHRPLTAVYAVKEIWDYVESLPQETQSAYWGQVPVGGYKDSEEAAFVIRRLNAVQRYEDSLMVIAYGIYQEAELPTALMTDTVQQWASFPRMPLTSSMEVALTRIIKQLDRRADADPEKLFFIEFVFYDLLNRQGYGTELKLLDELMSNPRSFMEVLKFAYPSSGPEEGRTEHAIEQQNLYRRLAFSLLWDMRCVPCMDRSLVIDKGALKHYIAELRQLGAEARLSAIVDHAVGELLANYPETEGDYPPEAICEIIEGLNNKEVNLGFRTRMFNKRGVTVRPAFAGGTLERTESAKYKSYADKVRFMYPAISRMFDALSAEYADMALQEDARVKIEKMEY